MTNITIRTGVRFDGSSYGNLVVPPETDDLTLQQWTEKLAATGLTVRPGYDEKREQPLLRLTNAENPEQLNAAVRTAFKDAPQEIQYIDATVKEKPEGLNNFSEFVYEKAPIVYDNAGHITGAFFLGAAACFAKSAFDNDQKAKKLTALGLATSASVIGLYAKHPKDPQDVHTILNDIKEELDKKGKPDLGTVLEEKEPFLNKVNETLRRYHWEAASLINVPANAFWLASAVKSYQQAQEGEKNWMEPAVSAAMTMNNAIRVVMPQKGGQSILSRLPFKPTEIFAEKLENGEIPYTEWLRENPVNMTSNISNAGKVAGVIAGMKGGKKKDPWLAAAMPTEFVGNLFAKMSGKPVGIGMDELATTGADFVADWDYEGTIDQKVNFIARKLSKREEVIHTESDIAEGIRLRLSHEQHMTERDHRVIPQA